MNLGFGSVALWFLLSHMASCFSLMVEFVVGIWPDLRAVLCPVFYACSVHCPAHCPRVVLRQEFLSRFKDILLLPLLVFLALLAISLCKPTFSSRQEVVLLLQCPWLVPVL